MTAGAGGIGPAFTGHSRVDGRIGIELDDVGTTTQPVFVDAMKQATPWTAVGGLRLDAWGNAIALAPGQVAQTIVCAGGAYPAGDYVLLFDGSGSLSVDAGTVIERAAGRIVLRLSPRSAGVRLQLTATDPHNYVRNIRLIAPGYEGSYARAPFFPGFVSALQHFHVVRFANWAHAATFTDTLDWAARSTTNQFTQAVATGVAPEYLIALANASGDDPWFVFPAGVTDAYVMQFAALVRTTLDPRLHPIFEYGQAMLVPGSPNQRYAAFAGLSAGLAYSPQTAAPAWYAWRSGQLFERLMTAFGFDGTAFHRVLAVPPAAAGTSSALVAQNLLAAPAARLADVLAVADLPQAEAPAQSALQSQAIVQMAVLARRSNLALWAYAADVSAPAAAAARPAERALYDTLFDGWHAAGGGLAVTSSSGFAGKWAGVADALRRYPMPHAQPLGATSPAPANSNAAQPAAVAVRTAQKPVPGTDVIAINCGGSAVGTWVADTDFSAGNTYQSTNSVATSSVMDPAPQAVYQSQRLGSTPFTYTIPGLTPKSAYTVRLHFAELVDTGAGQRVFNVIVNGVHVLTNFDVFATTGGQNIAVIENFYATANAAGKLIIEFTSSNPQLQNPIINGIEIQIPGPIDVLDINAGGAATGNWLADVDFSGGGVYSENSTPIVTAGVANPAPQAVYQSERFSPESFSYTIPGLTPGAAYTTRLQFAELTDNAKGARIFNVSINGTPVLTNFDIFAAAGGEFKAVARAFTVTADGAGQIAILFTPVRSSPQINGIEIEALPAVDAAAIAAGGAGIGVWAPNTDAPPLIATTMAVIGTSGVSSPAPQTVYQTQRFMNTGPLVYAVPGLTPGAAYAVRLHFAELSATGPGQRVFDVGINDTPVLTNFDIYAAAGGQNAAIVETFSATANSAGQIVINLTNIVGNPAINGIEVINPNTPAPAPAPTPTPTALCIGGTSYAPAQDDEFSHDTTVNYSPDLIVSTPQPDGAIWSSRAWGFQSDYSRNNIGTDDAYYTDPTRGLGPYSPYSLSGGALTITAVPVPKAYKTAPQLLGAHWLSGLLESPQLTYGYIEISAALPDLQGQFSAPLWLLGSSGSDGNGNGYEELDVNEMFGDTYAPSNVVFQTNHYVPAAPGSQQVVQHVADEVELNSTTSFHTYGVLWTPSVVRFYIDRQPMSPDWVNGSFGPAHAILNLGVFTEDTWAPGPPNKKPEKMHLQYYRWYQSTTQSCSVSQMPS